MEIGGKRLGKQRRGQTRGDPHHCLEPSIDIDSCCVAAPTRGRVRLVEDPHKHISLIAALTSHLVGKNAEARQWLARAKQADPEISSEVFFASFPFAENGARETIEKGLRELGV